MNKLAHFTDTKNICLVSWQSESGGIYQRQSVIRDFLYKGYKALIFLENGPEIPLDQVLSISSAVKDE